MFYLSIASIVSSWKNCYSISGNINRIPRRYITQKERKRFLIIHQHINDSSFRPYFILSFTNRQPQLFIRGRRQVKSIFLNLSSSGVYFFKFSIYNCYLSCTRITSPSQYNCLSEYIYRKQ